MKFRDPSGLNAMGRGRVGTDCRSDARGAREIGRWRHRARIGVVDPQIGMVFERVSGRSTRPGNLEAVEPRHM